jgi:hypothetical protein
MPKAVIAAVLAGSAVAGAADAAPPDEAAIRSNVAAYETAWNKRDVAGVLATYTPDADVVVFDGPRTAGREAMRARLREDLAAGVGAARLAHRGLIELALLVFDAAGGLVVAPVFKGLVERGRDGLRVGSHQIRPASFIGESTYPGVPASAGAGRDELAGRALKSVFPAVKFTAALHLGQSKKSLTLYTMTRQREIFTMSKQQLFHRSSAPLAYALKAYQ